MLLGFCVSVTKGFYPGPSTAIFVPSPALGRCRAGRAGACGAPGPSRGRRKEKPRFGPALPGCSPASAAPVASCGCFSLGALTLFSRRDAPPGPRLPGDGRLRPGLKSNFPSSGAGGGGGNRLSRWPPRFSRPGGRTAVRATGRGAQAWRQRGVQNSPSPGGRGRRKSGSEGGNPPCLPVRRRGMPTVVPGRPGPRYRQTEPAVGSAGDWPGAVVRRAGRDLIFSCHPSVCPIPATLRADRPKTRSSFYLPSSPAALLRRGVKPMSAFPPWRRGGLA